MNFVGYIIKTNQNKMSAGSWSNPSLDLLNYILGQKSEVYNSRQTELANSLGKRYEYLRDSISRNLKLSPGDITMYVGHALEYEREFVSHKLNYEFVAYRISVSPKPELFGYKIRLVLKGKAKNSLTT